MDWTDPHVNWGLFFHKRTFSYKKGVNNRMKKSLKMLLSVVTLSLLASCGGNNGGTSNNTRHIFQGDSTVPQMELPETDIGTSTTPNAEKLAAYTAEHPLKLGLVTDSGTLNDHSFNQSAWDGLNQFAVKNGHGSINSTTYCVDSGSIQTKYIQPAEGHYDTAGRFQAIQDVVTWGAKVVILPGFLFESTIKKVIDDTTGKFNDVSFLALDCQLEDPDNGYAPYTYTDKITSIIYREEQSGYLAGYAAVKEGYRNLGFCGGMAVPAVIRYGSGYVQGADAAAKELNLEDGAIQVNYYYAGQFAATPDATANCNSWYKNGTEVIFGCGGAVFNSVTTASKQNGGKAWIGVDVNQHADTELGASQATCITSAMKNLANTVEVMLASYIDNSGWNETAKGKVITVGAKSDNCVLPTPETTGDDGCWGFKNFTIAEYKTLLGKLKSGEVRVNSYYNNQDGKLLEEHNFGASKKTFVNYIA